MHFPNSDALNKYVASLSDGTAILSFSNGKDAIAAWLVMRKYFKKIVPFYLYLVPDLEFIEHGLKYYEEFFGTKILRYPHPSLYRMLNNLVLQSPEKCLPIEMANLPDFDFDRVHTIVHEDHDLPDTVYTATGVTASDSMVRRVAIKRNGALNVTRKTFFPIYDYKRADLVKVLEDAKIKLPHEYSTIGRSFDGINIQYIEPIKEHYPRDWERIKHWFGLCEIDILRMKFREDYYNGTHKNEETYKV